jgi:hypothetical protein
MSRAARRARERIRAASWSVLEGLAGLAIPQDRDFVCLRMGRASRDIVSDYPCQRRHRRSKTALLRT